MEWDITIHNDYKYIEVVTKGVADKDGSMDMAKSISETMRRHRITKALIDHRNVTNISGSVLEAYERPKLFKIIGVILGIKIAEIINPDHLEHFKFLETVCLNQGYKFSVYYDRTEALEWLLG
ncbi:MAG: hypothetical protein V1720_22645 [bacterium]